MSIVMLIQQDIIKEEKVFLWHSETWKTFIQIVYNYTSGKKRLKSDEKKLLGGVGANSLGQCTLNVEKRFKVLQKCC